MAEADFIVSAVTSPLYATLGQAVQLGWTVTNQGSGTATESWYDDVYISTDETFDDSDTLVTFALIDFTETPLDSGSSYTIILDTILPFTAIGDRYLLVVADALNFQEETDETNNVLAVPITLNALPTPPIVGTLSTNETIFGTLSSDDAFNPDPSREGSYSDDYILTGFTEGESLILSLGSDEFDVYLQLINADTQEIIAENDDSEIDLNSLLAFTPTAGINYIVRATSFLFGDTGNYTLQSVVDTGIQPTFTEVQFSVI
jgi:hypothetical protein